MFNEEMKFDNKNQLKKLKVHVHFHAQTSTMHNVTTFAYDDLIHGLWPWINFNRMRIKK